MNLRQRVGLHPQPEELIVSHQRTLLSLALGALFVSPAAHATVDLIAIGSLDAHVGDLATQTAAPLENGIAGNLLGGIGSGLTYAGCNTLLAVPDRGPNAVPFDTPVSDTASYINRFQTLTFTLAPSAPGSLLAYDMDLTLTATTLLRTAQKLVYGDGLAYSLPDGAPTLNAVDHTNYFTGRSDNFDGTRLSSYALDARFDPESIRVSNDGASVYISDEYGPYIYRFSRKTGQRTLVVPVPDSFAVSNLRANGDDEIAANASGRVTNKGMEGLAISPDGNVLYGAMQSPLAQDNGTSGKYTRILKIDLITGATTQYAYPLTNLAAPGKTPKYPTISDIVAINDHELLLDERDGKGLGDNSTAAFKKIFKVDITDAQDVSNTFGEINLAGAALDKTLFLDIVAVLTAAPPSGPGWNANDIPAKLEGITFGPDIDVDGATKHTFIVGNDNDFLAQITDTNHPNGIANPNRFFVFTVDPADVPDYQPQQLANGICKRNP